jgi:hypothetical protein
MRNFAVLALNPMAVGPNYEREEASLGSQFLAAHAETSGKQMQSRFKSKAAAWQFDCEQRCRTVVVTIGD